METNSSNVFFVLVAIFLIGCVESEYHSLTYLETIDMEINAHIEYQDRRLGRNIIGLCFSQNGRKLKIAINTTFYSLDKKEDVTCNQYQEGYVCFYSGSLVKYFMKGDPISKKKGEHFIMHKGKKVYLMAKNKRYLGEEVSLKELFQN